MRNTTEVLRRGLDSTLANWQLIAIRIAESLLFVLIVIASIFAAIVPVVVAAGLSHLDLKSAENPAEIFAAIVVEHWMLILYLLAIVTVLLGVLIAVHSFVEAGNAKIFVDAERGAARVAAPQRESFRAFSMDRWMMGGRSSWWSVFWIYNITWGIGGLVIVVPLLAAIAGMLMIDEPAGKVVMGCAGLLIALVLGIPLFIIIAVWTQKAIAVCVARAQSANPALRDGWSEIRGDFSRHFAVAFIVFVIAFGGAAVISMFTAPMSMLRHATSTPAFVDIAFAPAQILTSILQSVFSAAVGLWFLASYVGLTEER